MAVMWRSALKRSLCQKWFRELRPHLSWSRQTQHLCAAPAQAGIGTACWRYGDWHDRHQGNEVRLPGAGNVERLTLRNAPARDVL